MAAIRPRSRVKKKAITASEKERRYEKRLNTNKKMVKKVLESGLLEFFSIPFFVFKTEEKAIPCTWTDFDKVRNKAVIRLLRESGTSGFGMAISPICDIQTLMHEIGHYLVATPKQRSHERFNITTTTKTQVKAANKTENKAYLLGAALEQYFGSRSSIDEFVWLFEAWFDYTTTNKPVLNKTGKSEFKEAFEWLTLKGLFENKYTHKGAVALGKWFQDHFCD